MDLDRRIRERELLNVGVDRDELDVLDAGVDHPVDRVQAGAADADDADDREIRAGLGTWRPVKAGRRLRHRLDARQFLDWPQVRSRRRFRSGRDLGLGLGLGRKRLERRGVLDRLLERLLRSSLRDRLGFGLGLRLVAVLPLGGLCRPEELRERALTHAGALASH